MSISVVWFKRDLRLQDHAPLQAALATSNPILLLYILETELLEHPYHSPRHWQFVMESILNIQDELRPLGHQLHCIQGSALQVFQAIHERHTIASLFSHEETGLDVTYSRDKKIKAWTSAQGITWKEYQTGGIQRGRLNRAGWLKSWHQIMQTPVITLDKRALGSAVPVNLSTETVNNTPPEKFIHKPLPNQKGGRSEAQTVLNSFLSERIYQYSSSISKPEESRQGCSRLSSYLAWGNLSLREVYQTRKNQTPAGAKRPSGAFGSRLQWHDHFIQKFEMEPRYEFEPINRAYLEFPVSRDQGLLEAWKSGQTGIPMVDACMRALIETGYLNFRMRAMLVSVLTHHMNLSWKWGSAHLAQNFLDFEPGIHFPQMQMQAGLTGINTLRIYNPVKQGLDHDPQGKFIKKWLPELSEIPGALIHEPYKLTAMEHSLYRVPEIYQTPVIDLTLAGKQARQRMWSFRNQPEVKREGQRIFEKHTNPGVPRNE